MLQAHRVVFILDGNADPNMGQRETRHTAAKGTGQQGTGFVKTDGIMPLACSIRSNTESMAERHLLCGTDRSSNWTKMSRRGCRHCQQHKYAARTNRQVETAFNRVSRDAPETLGKTFCVTEIAAGRNLGTARDEIKSIIHDPESKRPCSGKTNEEQSQGNYRSA